MFQIKVKIDVGGVVGRYVDVARKKKLVVLQYQEGDDCIFTLGDIAASLAQEVTVEMYEGAGEGLNYQLGRLIASNEGARASEYIGDCVAAKSGYHYILLSASEGGMQLFPRVVLNFMVTPYPCPYQPLYLDSNEVYPACNSSTAVFPCLQYREGSGVCGECAEGYVLQETDCYVDAKCDEKEYFDKGECKAVISNCASFAKVGGQCWECNAGFKLLTIGTIQFCYFDTSNQPTQPSTGEPQPQVTDQTQP